MQVGIGLLVGLLVSLAISRLIERFLFGISAVDPQAVFIVMAALALAGLLAALAPAIRASRVPPLAVLKG